MRVRYYIDASTSEPHIYRHDVSEGEVEEALGRPLEDRPGHDGARVAIGKSRSGRFLRIIYVPDPEPRSIFVITAYDLGPKALKALKRRLKKRR
jgi:hypothetical protein